MPDEIGKKTRARDKLDIGAVLKWLEKERKREDTDGKTAAAIGIPANTYSVLKSGKASPTIRQLQLMAEYWAVPLERFLSPDLFARTRGGLRWQVCTGLGSQRERVMRDVTEAVLRGETMQQIAERFPPHERTDWMIGSIVRHALTDGIVRLVLSPGAVEAQDAELAVQLSDALTREAHAQRPITVLVVRNFAHPDFVRDPLIPFLTARLAHPLVARFLAGLPHDCTIGIAGGIHVADFVRTIGHESSPFPEGGDRRFTLVPLTLEPFHEHRYEMADPLVGEFFYRASGVVGPQRVKAPSFKPFGYLENRKVGALETDSILIVREQYLGLDVAIYGCGDGSDDGWLDSSRKMVGLPFDPRTDVCLNPLSKTGEPIPISEDAGRREYLGVSIEQIRSLVGRRDKLALLLASSESKGEPITLVARAGCANAVICDQAAARAALEVLRRKESA